MSSKFGNLLFLCFTVITNIILWSTSVRSNRVRLYYFSDFQQEQFELLQVPVESSIFYRQFKKAPNKLELSAFSPKVIEIQNEAKYVISEKVLPGSIQYIVYKFYSIN